MLRDAELGYACEKQMDTPWVLSASRAMGAAYLLLGRPHDAIAVLRESLALSTDRPELSHTRVFTLGYLVFAAAELGERRDAQRWAVEASWLAAQQHLHDTIYGAIAYTAGALAHNQRGDQTEAARQLENVRRLRPLLRVGPWLNADLALRCADISLDLGDVAGALDHAQVAGDALQGYPDAGTLPARLQRLQARIKRGHDYGLTPAELRLVPFLATHLSLQDIADRLHLARPTVKTHVASIYDKLGVTCRSNAVEIIEHAGLESTEANVTIPGTQLDSLRDVESPLADRATISSVLAHATPARAPA
jgi:LuxR family maltose regulon positive regulatory protein